MTIEHPLRALISHEARELSRMLQSKIKQDDGLPEIIPDVSRARTRDIVPPRSCNRSGIWTVGRCGRATERDCLDAKRNDVGHWPSPCASQRRI
ncbi:hypothetical protein BRAS3809_6310006 [Bradyrhizobium sp. STM 3809]|nr:hypothetical protein BRAS3809_6310006 [Bradyrhizobium sp. STM 3809]